MMVIFFTFHFHLFVFTYFQLFLKKILDLRGAGRDFSSKDLGEAMVLYFFENDSMVLKSEIEIKQSAISTVEKLCFLLPRQQDAIQ